MLENVKPGQQITLTVEAEPRRDDQRQTIQRLMRRDPQTSKALRRGQLLRKRNLRTKQRGGRQWAIRERVGKVAHAARGATWTMTYTPDLEQDLRSIERFVAIRNG